MENAISVEINGHKLKMGKNTTIKDAAELLEIEDANVVAELNGRIVKNADFSKTPLEDGAKLELVRFVGGG